MRTLLSLVALSSLLLAQSLEAEAKRPASEKLAPPAKKTNVAEKETPAKKDAEIHEPQTKAEYDKIVKKAKDEGKHVAVKHSTDWCSFCKQVADVFDELLDEVHNFVFIELDGDNQEFKDIKKDHKVSGYPTTVVIDTKKDQKHIIKGADKFGIQRKVKDVSTGKTASAPAQAPKPAPAPAKKPAPAAAKNDMKPAKKEVAEPKKKSAKPTKAEKKAAKVNNKKKASM